MVRNLPVLLSRLKQAGYYIAIESNGLGKVAYLIDYIARSLKFCYQSYYHKIAQPTANKVLILDINKQDFII